jgi:hypothetical protein
MAFTGNEGEMIEPKEGQLMINNYQKGMGPTEVKAVFFGANKLNQLLAQGKAVGIRFYFAQNEQGLDTLVAVAANAAEGNIGPVDGSTSAGLVLDKGDPCPPYCNTGG